MVRIITRVQQELLPCFECIQLGRLGGSVSIDLLREDYSQFNLQTVAQILNSLVAYTKALYRLQIL